MRVEYAIMKSGAIKMEISDLNCFIIVSVPNPNEELVEIFQNLVIETLRGEKEKFGIKKIEEKENFATISSSKLTLLVSPLEVEISSEEGADRELLEEVLEIAYTLLETLNEDIEESLCMSYLDIRYEGEFSNFLSSFRGDETVELNEETVKLSGLEFEVEEDTPCPFDIFVRRSDSRLRIEECVGEKSLCEVSEPRENVEEIRFEEKVERAEKIWKIPQKAHQYLDFPLSDEVRSNKRSGPGP